MLVSISLSFSHPSSVNACLPSPFCKDHDCTALSPLVQQTYALVCAYCSSRHVKYVLYMITSVPSCSFLCLYPCSHPPIRDLSLQDKEWAYALVLRTLSCLHDILRLKAWTCTYASTCTRCHHASHWAEQMNNMPVTELIHLPTPELYRYYLSELVGVRTCVSVHSLACFPKWLKAALQYLLSKSEIIPPFASCTFLILCIYKQFFFLYLDCF